jgi:hypothetical protein
MENRLDNTGLTLQKSAYYAKRQTASVCVAAVPEYAVSSV